MVLQAIPTGAAAGDHDRGAARGLGRGVVRRRFEAGVLRAGRGGPAPALLHDVGQFVGEQMTAARRSRRIFAAAKHDVAADRVGARRAGRGGRRGALIGMHAHRREVVAEAGVKSSQRSGIERMAGLIDDIADITRRGGGPSLRRRIRMSPRQIAGPSPISDHPLKDGRLFDGAVAG